jgi:purine-binding chemotaxis protein CheW
VSTPVAGARPAEGGGLDPLVELCAFRVGSEEYVIDVRRVREVVSPAEIRPVPRAPEFIEGVADLRGEIVPVVDVRKRLALPAGPRTRKTRFLVVLLGRRAVALLVDAVLEVVRIPRSAIRPAAGLAKPDAPRLFLGVCGGPGSGGGRLKLLLNARALLEPHGPEEIAAARALMEKGGE